MFFIRSRETFKIFCLRGNANADEICLLRFHLRWFMFKDAANTNIEWNIYYDEGSPFNEMDDYLAAMRYCGRSN